jgi:iron complex transport system substrate-binding protein
MTAKNQKNMPGLKSLKQVLCLAGLTVMCCAGLQAERIITLAPALTEIVFALGKGDGLVGDTRFCDFPEAAKTIAKVGGLMDLNVERIIDLKPNLIILYEESLDRIKMLENKTRLLVVRHDTLEQICRSILTISRNLSCPEQGAILVSDIRKTLNRIRSRTRGIKKRKILLIAGRNPDTLRNMTIIGRKDFLNEILEIAGGTNAYPGNIEYPSVSIESILSMNPDHIIEFSTFFQEIEPRKIMDLWNRFKTINAVKNHRITMISDPVWLRPGPRIGQVAIKLYRLLNPNDSH